MSVGCVEIEAHPTLDGHAPLLEAQHISKRFGGVTALEEAQFSVSAGQVHALLGENGAGKSTLMKILAGAHSPDVGQLFVRGEPTSFQSVHDAQRAGVSIVFQELTLFPDHDLLTNLFISNLPTRARWLVDRDRMTAEAGEVLDELGLHVPLTTRLSDLRLGDRQLVEIARALLQKSDILILDEPNSALNAQETERLLNIIGGLRDRGVGIVYVSHRLEEVFRVADHVTVLRNGSVAQSSTAAETSIPEVVRAMIGRDPMQISTAGADRTPVPATIGHLRLSDVTVRDRLEGVSLDASPGEVVGLAGLEGSGVATVLQVVFGQVAPDAGSVTLPDGRPGVTSIRQAVSAGIALVPSDRRRVGAMLEQSVKDNLSHVTAGVLGTYGWWLRRRALNSRAATRVETMRIKVASTESPLGTLSGGNQQKVVLGKWLETEPTIVLLDDPTRGVDVGSKAEIYELIKNLAAGGRVVVFSSSELMEYSLVCDRVVVLQRGRVGCELTGAEATEHALLEAINAGLASTSR